MKVKLHTGFDFVFCEDCGARGPVTDGHLQESIDGWNKVER